MKINLLLPLALAAILGTVAPAAAKLNVVATTPDLASLAQEIGGDLVSVTTLAKPTEDPHFVEPKPSFITKLNRADLLLEGGADLEVGWLPALVDQARNPKIAAAGPGRIRCATGVGLLEVPTTLDRSQGDIHALGNPHFLTDPANAEVVARAIATALTQADAANAASYAANLKKFSEALTARLAVWQGKLAPFKGRHVVAYHNSWPYFAKRFGLEIDLFLEPKPGIPPSPSHLAEVIGRMKSLDARVIILDPYLNRRTADTVASKTGAKVVEVAQYPGGVKGTEGGYLALMDYLVATIAGALEEKK